MKFNIIKPFSIAFSCLNTVFKDKQVNFTQIFLLLKLISLP